MNVFWHIFWSPRKIGLKTLKEDFAGDKKCSDCGKELKLGIDRNDYKQVYCQNCKKIVRTYTIPRFRPPIKIQKNNDGN
jgi:hypothetical protein